MIVIFHNISLMKANVSIVVMQGSQAKLIQEVQRKTAIFIEQSRIKLKFIG